MKLLLQRTERTATCTMGKLFIDSTLFCDTLEPTERRLHNISDKVKGRTAIPTGVYRVEIAYSNRFGCRMPRLMDVPMFDGILIHPGNTAADTAGCILVGITDKVGHLHSSRMMYNLLRGRIDRALMCGEQVTINVLS